MLLWKIQNLIQKILFKKKVEPYDDTSLGRLQVKENKFGVIMKCNVNQELPGLFHFFKMCNFVFEFSINTLKIDTIKLL